MINLEFIPIQGRDTEGLMGSDHVIICKNILTIFWEGKSVPVKSNLPSASETPEDLTSS